MCQPSCLEKVRVKLAEAEGLGALTQGVEGTELAPPAPSSTHTGEERRGIRAGSHFFFVVGKEDVPGATALPGTHMQSSQRRQACEVERLGGGGGQGGRAERERQRARVGRWGRGPEGKMVLMNPFAGQNGDPDAREQPCGGSGGRRGWGQLRQ